ncbi:Lrp/AsnC family transcriptional regulator [Streptomyces sp. NPDC049687]|uniref:Lrp/AsnC family transcriptional regulator n=1 Tax=Streptomyces sp. NPDC049687 TaxID=3365596 RepID=UPI0037A44261
MLDKLDRALLRELQRDARKTNRELADSTHVVPSTSLMRVRSLRNRGVITGFHAAVDLDLIGRGVQALISVKIKPPSRRVIETFREWVVQLPEVIGVFVTSGSTDFLVHVAMPSSDDLYSFVIDRLTQRPEVADVQTNLVYECLRTPVIEPAENVKA